MKKNSLNAILLLLCLVIYGAIFLKFFKKQTHIKTFEDSSHHFKVPKSEANSKQDFTLILPKRDPFLNKAYNKTITKPKKNKIVKKRTVQNQHPIKWPQIRYYGFLKTTKSTSRLALLKIDNILYKKKEKERIKDIEIVKAYNDSIKLRFNNSVVYIQRLSQ